MAYNVGFRTIAGARAESTYGTEIEVNTAVPLVSESLVFTPELTPRETLVGFAGYRSIRKAATVGTGDLVFEHSGILASPILTVGMGLWTDGAPNPDYYDLVDQKTASMTVAFLGDVSNRSCYGLKANTLTFSGTPADGCRITLGSLFQNQTLTSSVNTTGVLQALTLPTDGFAFEQLTIRIADLADAIAGGDAVSIGSYSLVSDWAMEQRQRNSTTRYEPRENGRRNSTLTVTLPFYETNQYDTWWRAQTNLQCDMVWTNGTRTNTLRIPLMQITNVTGTNVDGPGAPSPTVEFRLLVDSGALNVNTNFDFGDNSKTEYRLTEA